MAIGVVATPELPEFCVSATVTNYRMSLNFSLWHNYVFSFKSPMICKCAFSLS